MKSVWIPAAAGSLLLGACALPQPMHTVSDPTVSNPFFSESSLDYHMPRFDLIRDEHYAPALEAGMAQQIEEIEAIAGNADAATFDNTIVAMERSGDILGRVTRVFFNMVGAHTNDTLNKVQAEVAPKLAAHTDSIFLNAALFARVQSLHEQRQDLGLSVEQIRLVERYYTDFVRAGAKLNDDQKQRLREINAELSSLTTRFGQNLLKERNASTVFVDDAALLAGLSPAQVEAAAAVAKDAGKEGLYGLKLMNYSSQPQLSALKNRETREMLHKASMARGIRGGEFDYRELILKMAKLRAERAQLMGYPHHAAYVLEAATAKTTKAVNDMLGKLAPAAVRNAKNEAADMQKLIDAQSGGFKLAAWDWPFYAEQVRAQRYAFDGDQMKPYLELESVLVNGVFEMAKQVYGLTLEERFDLPVYQEDVRVFEVFEEDGSELGLFVFDPFARDSKRGGAWMNNYVPQNHLLGHKPVVGNHLNIPKPAEGPVLLSFDEVTTLFHEFGHAVHGLFSDVTYPYFSGTSVPRDFVEYPSQVHEMWATWPSILSNYARHYETGEAMPDELLSKFIAAENFNQGYSTTEYLAAAILDQAWHQLSPKQIPKDVEKFERAALKKAGILVDEVPTRYRSGYFAHIFAGGYSAGYYSYIWSEVLDADTVQWFHEHEGLKRLNGDWFREYLLSRGGSKEAMELFELFRGREPKIEPLLERRGLN